MLITLFFTHPVCNKWFIVLNKYEYYILSMGIQLYQEFSLKRTTYSRIFRIWGKSVQGLASYDRTSKPSNRHPSEIIQSAPYHIRLSPSFNSKNQNFWVTFYIFKKWFIVFKLTDKSIKTQFFGWDTLYTYYFGNPALPVIFSIKVDS